MLRRTSRITGAPAGALIWVGAGSLLTLLLFIHEPLTTRAVALSLTYGADLIIVAYILVVIPAIIFTIRRRMAPVKTVILLIGLAVLGYVVKATFAPFPAPLIAGMRSPPGSPWSPGSSCRSPTRRCGAGSANRPCSKPGPAPCSAHRAPQLTIDLAAVSGRDQRRALVAHVP
jgi:hypothetical protein